MKARMLGTHESFNGNRAPVVGLRETHLLSCLVTSLHPGRYHCSHLGGDSQVL